MVFKIYFNNLKTVYYWLPYLSGLIEEELVKKENFLSIVLDKSVFDLAENDFTLDMCVKLSSKDCKLKNCSPGVWKFTGKLCAIIKKFNLKWNFSSKR